MKALLVETKEPKNKRTAIIFLPSEKRQPESGDPDNVAVEMDGQNLRVWVILSDELETRFQVIRELDINGRLFRKAMEYRNAQIQCGRIEVEFKSRLLNEEIVKNCDAFSFLDIGSASL